MSTDRLFEQPGLQYAGRREEGVVGGAMLLGGFMLETETTRVKWCKYQDFSFCFY